MDAKAEISTHTTDDLQGSAEMFFRISSLAVALRHILGSLDGRDEQPLVSAIELCSMIEGIAQEEGGRLLD